MSLQFVTGSAGVDHRQPMLASLAAEVTAHPQDQFFYLVPNHIKFEAEVGVLTALKDRLGANDPLFAQTNVQVFSFSRLAWYFMHDDPLYQLPRLSPAGLNMLLYQLIQDHVAELTIFRGEADRPGFMSQLAQQLTELQTGRVSAADLMQAVTDLQTTGNPSAALQAKLHDMMIIYDAFEAQVAGQYLTAADLIGQLSQFLKGRDLQHTHVYLEGFSQLNAQERQLVQTLIEQAHQVTVALNVTHPRIDQQPNPQNLFYQSEKLYRQLYMGARAAAIPVLRDVKAAQPAVAPDLLALDTYWQASSQVGAPVPAATTLTDPQAIQVLRADNRYVELSQVATRIRQLVATGRYHYADFLVLSRHLGPYQTVIAPIFNAQEIPYFDDQDLAMADHPFVELLTALFDVDRKNYRYDDVFRVLKSELLLPLDEQGQPMALANYRQAVALTENLVLKNGYEGERFWTQANDWQYLRFTTGDDQVATTREDQITAQVNQIRQFVKQTLPPFFHRLHRVTTTTEAVTLLYQFLDRQGVPNRLMAWRDAALDRGDLVMAGQPEQTWETFCDLLDEFVAILGEAPYQPETFQALLQTGFAGATYAQIPATLDQVRFSESGIVQANQRKITFMIGSTDTNMPDASEATGMLTDSDKHQLTTVLQDQTADDQTPDKYLLDDTAVRLAGEPYLNYRAFLTATEQLIFTYPLTTEEDEHGTTLSPYVQRLIVQFKVPVVACPATPQADNVDIRPFVGTPRTTLRHLVQAANDSRLHNRPLSSSWRYVLDWLRQNPDMQALTTTLLGSIAYRNQPTPLAPEIVTGLYGQTINTSISKLEDYYANPYAYFLKYGLKLQERDVFALSPANTGEFFHATLDQLMKLVQAQHLDLAQLDDQQLSEMVDEVVAKLLDASVNPQYAILDSSARMGYIRQQLIATMKRMAFTLKHQADRTHLRPKKTEVQFGRVGSDGQLASLDFDLGQGHQVRVRGRIDRIDAVPVADAIYLGVVDYKSSAHNFDFVQAYYGQTMQMLTYLDAVAHNLPLLADADEDPAMLKLAGAVYLHLQNPVIKASDLKTNDEAGFITALLEAEKYQGLLVEEPQLLANLDTELAANERGSSKLFRGVTQKKDGGFRASNTLITADELALLLAHNEQLIRRAGREIFAGKVALQPTRYQQRTALDYSPYKAIMQFDPMLPENKYHELLPLDRHKIFDLIKTEQEDRHE